MQKLFSTIGWVIIVGGIAGGFATFYIVSSQDVFVSLLARLVERPYEYRGYLAIAAAAGVAALGILAGLLYVGIGQVLKKQASQNSS